MSTTSSAGMKRIDQISPAFTQLTFTTNFLEDLKSLLPVNVSTDNTYELTQIKFNEEPQSLYDTANYDDIQNDILGVEKARTLFNSLTGFPIAQQLVRYIQAIEDLRRNPTLSYDDSIYITKLYVNMTDKTKPLTEVIFTLKRWNKETATTEVITKFDEVTDLEDLSVEDKTNINLIINKYKDTNWITYDVVNYMNTVNGGLKVNPYRGTGITPIDYVSAASASPDSFNIYTQLTSPLPASDLFSGSTTEPSASGTP